MHGSTSGDGSAAKPWRTFADVVNPANKLISTQGHNWDYSKGDTALHAVNPTAPVKAGDLILLKSGDHGAVTITDMYNSDFITVAAAPGATPILDKLQMVSSAKWLFQGVTFQGLASTATGATKVNAGTGWLISTGYGDWEGPTSDIAFDADTFESAASTSGWTDVDWVNKPYAVAMRISAPCTSVTNGHFLNLYNAIGVGANSSLVQGNTIEKFSNDAIDVVASNVLVKNNAILNGVNTPSDPSHADGIQGWSGVVNGVTATNTNVVIDGNILTKINGANNTYMQGISIFDGKWNGLVIQNNVVNVNTWNAIAVLGATNSKILNNTVIGSDPANHPSWIEVHAAKDGTASTGMLVRNNIATQYDIENGTTFDHNIAAASITTYPGGTKSVATTGTVGTANSVLPAVVGGFMTVNAATATFDMRLRPRSPAIGFGTLTGAPALDILGKTRTSPVDAGAYNH